MIGSAGDPTSTAVAAEPVAVREMYTVVAFIPAVTDASFNVVPSTPVNTLPAAVANDDDSGPATPAAFVLVVKSTATAILFCTSVESTPVAPFAIARIAE